MQKRVNQIEDYFRVKVESASPMGLIYMVYERAITTIQSAKENLNSRNRDKFCKNIIHAQDCIRELRSSLNLEISDVAKSLYSLYNFMLEELVAANMTRENPLSKLNRVEKMLSELYSTWKLAERRLNESKKSQTVVSAVYQPLSVNA
ncbi:MAG: hypothetical protein ACD_79C01012G0002 [uncultured bacterium]|nr:MAG: hypothetical protein ACD_79C01012G0002 [uncultured bacterium]